MNGVGDGGTIVWQRDIDEEAGSRRWRKFLQFYVGPAVVVAIIAAVAGGIGAALGILILTGLFGLLIAGWIWFTTHNERANPEIRLADGELTWGNVRVPVADIELWSTHYSTRPSTGLGSGGLSAVVLFRIPVMDGAGRGVRADGGQAYETRTFGWADMNEPTLDGVRESLMPHIPTPWVTPEQLKI